MKKREEERNKLVDLLRPRMYSLGTFKKLVFKYLNRSKLKTKVTEQKEAVLPDMTEKIASVKEEMSTIVEDFRL